LEINDALENRIGMANSYDQLGLVTWTRGDPEGAAPWYHKALEIQEALGDRTGKAITCLGLGLVAETLGDSSGALEWIIRCVILFPEFPHPSTGAAANHLARLTAELGMAALEASWKRCTDEPLPGGVRGWVAARLKENSQA
jgi:hypothetical protein